MTVPVLIKGLEDRDPRARACAAWSLREFGPEASQAVVALRRLVDDENEALKLSPRDPEHLVARDAALEALQGIETKEARGSALPVQPPSGGTLGRLRPEEPRPFRTIDIP
jgi:HEAT repeat protein